MRKRLLLKSVHILGVRIDRPDFPEILSLIKKNRDAGLCTHIATVNSLMLLDCDADPLLRKILNESSLNLPESSGVVLAARMKGLARLKRIPGIDLMMELCREADRFGWSLFLVGAKPGVAQEAAARLNREFPRLKIAGHAHGYLNPDEEMEILNRIQKLKPDFLFVAMGSPRQEQWIAENKARLGGLCAMGVGGSFDVLAGRLRRSPVLFQKLGLEWLHRWAQEPWRAKRMLRLPVFLIKALIHSDQPI